MRECENPECNKLLKLDAPRNKRFCNKKCCHRADYLNNGDAIRAKALNFYHKNKGIINTKRAAENLTSEQRVKKAEYDRARRAAGITHNRAANHREVTNALNKANRKDPIKGPKIRASDREKYNTTHGNMKSKISGGLYKCLNRFGEGKEQIGSFTIDGDDSWLDYTKERAMATLFLVTHNAAWMIAHGYTHALTIERDGDGIPIDFSGNYHLHHIKQQHTFEGRIADPSTRREAIRELWALDNLVLIHKDEHKHYHSKDNQPSNQSTKSGEMNDE